MANQSRAWVTLPLRELPERRDFELVAGLQDGQRRAGLPAAESAQIYAWEQELGILRHALARFSTARVEQFPWTLALEFAIPRRDRRLDALVLGPGGVAAIEFKVGATSFRSGDIEQIEDYLLELRDFHAASSTVKAEGVLIATGAAESALPTRAPGSLPIWLADPSTLGDAVERICAGSGPAYQPSEWLASEYRPTPTIIEAARRMLDKQQIRELTQAWADDLGATTAAVTAAVHHAREHSKRVICFVTGVPGAGKTLAGLRSIQELQLDPDAKGLASFMAGNGPLVRILREALARHHAQRGETKRSGVHIARVVVQDIHRFLEEYGVKSPQRAPPEHVIAFDEAQRAWNAERLRKRHPELSLSEPALTLDIMSRPERWSVVIALVGGGQEIHRGEAGLAEWGRAIEATKAPWEVQASPAVLQGDASVAGHVLFEKPQQSWVRVRTFPALHLSVSVRSPRAQHLAEWVNAVLDGDASRACAALAGAQGFRLVLTRDLDAARRWLRRRATGELRSGLVSSSSAVRLRAHGIEVASDFHRAYPFERWFLDDRTDHRSSHMLEVAATEFECQGLELDYVGLCWGDDFTFDPVKRAWRCRQLRGNRWTSLKDEAKVQYRRNKYRVLLTRARLGMVIWVPPGSTDDPTRPPGPMQETADFLSQAGVASLQADDAVVTGAA